MTHCTYNWSRSHFQVWLFTSKRICKVKGSENKKYTNREITTTWYYVNSRRNIDSDKHQVPDGIWTHAPPWSSRMLYHWATGDSVVSKVKLWVLTGTANARLRAWVQIPSGTRSLSENKKGREKGKRQEKNSERAMAKNQPNKQISACTNAPKYCTYL